VPISNIYNFISVRRYSKNEEVYNFDCILSIDVIKVETISTVRGATRNWNMTVQFWLSEYVYKRFPVKQFRYINNLKRVHNVNLNCFPLLCIYRTLAAFGMSAVWHGVYLGYYISLCSVPFYLAVEDIYDKHYRSYADSAGVSIIR